MHCNNSKRPLARHNLLRKGPLLETDTTPNILNAASASSAPLAESVTLIKWKPPFISRLSHWYLTLLFRQNENSLFMNGAFISHFPEAWWKLIKNPSSVFSAGSHSCRLTHIWDVLYCLCFPLSVHLLYWYHVFEVCANHVPAFYQNEINKLFGYVLGGYHCSLKSPFCSHTHHLLLIRPFSCWRRTGSNPKCYQVERFRTNQSVARVFAGEFPVTHFEMFRMLMVLN